MSPLADALNVILAQIQNDLRSVSSDVYGYDPKIAAEAVAAYGFVQSLLRVHATDPVLGDHERQAILTTLSAVREGVFTPSLVLHDSRKCEEYDALLDEITSLKVITE